MATSGLGDEEAYKLLMGKAADPSSASDAEKLRGLYFRALCDATAPDPVLEREVAMWPQTEASTSLPRPRYASLSTGMRVCYLEWGTGGEEIVILLHDAGSSARVWAPVASRLAVSGFRVIAPDLRGHGGSTWSGDKRYSAKVLAEDVRALVVALDLYTRPAAVVGVGVGAAVALTFTLANPGLVGALSLLEFALPELGDSNEEAAEGGQSTSPAWWSGYPGQGAVFQGVAELAALLGHPLATLGPLDAQKLAGFMLRLQPASGQAEPGDMPAREDADKEAARQGIQAFLRGGNRRPASAAAAAWAAMPVNLLLRPQSVPPRFSLAADPGWRFHFDPEWTWRRLSGLRAHLQVLVGASSGWVTEAQCRAMAETVCDPPAPVAVSALPGLSHCALPDAAPMIAKNLLAFLEGPAIAALQRPREPAQRRPETLGLRPLPEYQTLEEAKKALGPRALPSAEAVAQELQRLALENGEDPEDEAGSSADARQTALANNPSDYYGMIG